MIFNIFIYNVKILLITYNNNMNFEHKEIEKELNIYNGLGGLYNNGNICYLNTGIQLMNIIPEVVNYFKNKEYINDMINNDDENKMNDLAYQFSILFFHIWNHNKPCIPTFRAISFGTIINKKYVSFDNFEHQDVQECLQAFFRIIEQETKIKYEDVDLNEEMMRLDEELDDNNEMEMMIEKYERVREKILEYKTYKRNKYLNGKYKFAYTIFDKIFTIGYIKTIKCDCGYNSINYSDDMQLFVDLPMIEISEEKIEKELKLIENKEQIENFEEQFVQSIRSLLIDEMKQRDKILFDHNNNLKLQQLQNKNDSINSNKSLMNESNDDLDIYEEKILYNNIDLSDISSISSPLYNNDDDNVDNSEDNVYSFTRLNSDEINMNNEDDNKEELLMKRIKENEEMIRNIDERRKMIMRTIRINKIKQKLLSKEEINIEECLEGIFKDEKLEDYRCSCCKRKDVNLHRSIEIYELPKYLIIQLKRFDMVNDVKNNIRIIFNEEYEGFKVINLSKYINGDGRYKIIGVANHNGGINGGHYYSNVYNSHYKKWYVCNDEKVNEIRYNEVEYDNAYILLCEKI